MLSTGSTSELSFSVRDWFAWAPGRETRDAWRAWARGSAVPAEAGAGQMPPLPLALRRRATKIGQKVLGAALACRDVERARYVVASRHGEYDRTVTILTSLANGEAPSPAEFSMSVHHGLAGLLSIHTGNREGHVAVAAGQDSFTNGLIEAALCLTDVPALVLYYDSPLPDEYDLFRLKSEAQLPIVLALLLVPADAEALTLRWEPASAGPHGVENQALTFLRWLLSKAPQAACQGERMNWQWRRAA